MIAAYEGTVILVSHDRDFLDRTVTSVFHAEGEGKWVEYAGGYSDMKAQQKSGAAKSDKAEKAVGKADKATPSGDAPTLKSAQKLSYKHKFRLEKLPAEMEGLRVDIAAAEAVLADADLYAKDPERFDQAAKKLKRARTALAAAEDEWLELEILRETHST